MGGSHLVSLGRGGNRMPRGQRETIQHTISLHILIALNDDAATAGGGVGHEGITPQADHVLGLVGDVHVIGTTSFGAILQMRRRTSPYNDHLLASSHKEGGAGVVESGASVLHENIADSKEREKDQREGSERDTAW